MDTDQITTSTQDTAGSQQTTATTPTQEQASINFLSFSWFDFAHEFLENMQTIIKNSKS